MIKKLASFIRKFRSNKGFSLMEISVAVAAITVLIGITAGGVTMIRKIKLNSVISKVNEYIVALEEFKNDYDGIPGDISNVSRIEGAVPGNGNGVIDTDSEAINFWRHLSLTGILAGSYDGVSKFSPGKGIPKGNLEKSGYSVVNPEKLDIPNINDQMLIFEFSAFTGNSGGLPLLTPEEAYNIDKKSDDGFPNSGIIRAAGSSCLSGENYNLQLKEKVCILYFIVSNSNLETASESNYAKSGNCSVVGQVREKPDYSSEIKERCPEGYTGKIIEKCLVDQDGEGVWEAAQKICNPVTCSGNKKYGEKRVLECINDQEGSEGSGSGGITQICSGGGSWEEIDRDCLFSDTALQSKTCESGEKSIQMACGWFESGYALMTCGSDGEWGNLSDRCNSVVTCSGFNTEGVSPSPVGSRKESTESCGIYYTGTTYDVCAPDGKWYESSYNSCVPVYGNCENPDEERDISCPLGETGKHIQKCVGFNSNNYWVTEKDTCSPVRCGSFNLGEYRVSLDECPNNSKGVIMEICSLSSDELSHEWIKNYSNCTAPVCVGFGNEEGFAVWPDTNVGDNVSGVCLEGYAEDLGIAPSRSCNSEGKWGDVVNSCIRKECPEIESDSSDLFHGFASWPKSYYMTKNIQGKCIPGYTGNPVRDCNSGNEDDDEARWGEVIPGFECKEASDIYVYGIAKDGSLRKIDSETGDEEWSYSSPSGAISAIVVNDKEEVYTGDFLSPYEVRRIDNKGKEEDVLYSNSSAINELRLVDMNNLIMGDEEGNIVLSELYSLYNTDDFTGETLFSKRVFQDGVGSIDSDYRGAIYVAGASGSSKSINTLSRNLSTVATTFTSGNDIPKVSFNNYYERAPGKWGVFHNEGNSLKYKGYNDVDSWSINVGSRIKAVKSDFEYNAIVSTENSHLIKVDPGGSVLWDFSFSDVNSGFDDIVIDDYKNIYAIDHEGSVRKVSESGEILWSFTPNIKNSVPDYNNHPKKLAITPGNGTENNWPGGVVRPSLWFDSLSYFSTNSSGSNYSWYDISRNEVGHVVKMDSVDGFTDNSVFYSEGINRHNALHFPGNSTKKVFINSRKSFDTDNFTMFFVLNSYSTGSTGSVFSADGVVGTYVGSSKIAAIGLEEGNSNYISVSLDIIPNENYILTQSQSDGIQKLSLNNGTVKASFLREIDNSFKDSYSTGDSNYLFFGGYDSKYFNGNIGEIIVYNRSLLPSEKSSIEEYLSEKWGVEIYNRDDSYSFPKISSATLKLWYDADDPFGSGTPDSSVSELAILKDKSGNNNDLKGIRKETSASLDLNSVNGLPAVNFNNGNNGIALRADDFDAISQPNTVFVVAKNSSSASGYLFSSGVNSMHYKNNAYFDSNKYSFESEESYVSNFENSNSAYIATYVFNKDESKIYVNGALKDYPVSLTDGRIKSFILGNNIHGDSRLNGMIGEVLVYQGILEFEEKAEIEKYLSEKWGIDLESNEALNAYAGIRSNNIIKGSDDMKVWELAPVDKDVGIITACAYSKENMWLIGNGDGKMFFSGDASIWESTNISSRGEISSIVTDNQGLWIASGTGNSSQLYYSTDNAKNWSFASHVAITDASWKDIVYSKEAIIAVGSNSFKNKAAIAVSFDKGKVWNDLGIRFPSSENLYSVSYNSSAKRFIVGGENGAVYFSDNRGNSWTRVLVNNENNNVNDIFYANNTWVLALGADLYYSDTNGASWEKSSESMNFGIFTKIGYYDGIWFAGSSYYSQKIRNSKNNGRSFLAPSKGKSMGGAVSCFMHK